MANVYAMGDYKKGGPLDLRFLCISRTYADDTMFVVHGLTKEELKFKGAVTLSEEKSWLNANTLKLNEEKTQIIRLGPRATGETAKCLGI